MKKSTTLILILAALLQFTIPSFAQTCQDIEGQIIVRLSDPSDSQSLLDMNGVTRVQQLTPTLDPSLFLLKFNPGKISQGKILKRLGRMDIVKKAEPDQAITFPRPDAPIPVQQVQRSQTRAISDSAPNDSLFDQQWNLQAIHMPELWKIPLKSDAKRPIIAILDLSFNIEHPDLKDNIWTNQTELDGLPGVDDDGNGLIDDIHGWNFADSNDDMISEVFPDHGTFCAGVAAAVANNGIGIAGANPDAIVMPLRIAKDTTIHGVSTYSFLLSAEYQAIDYAIANGADIISMSYGMPVQYPLDYYKLMDSASRHAILVAAAGNRQCSVYDGDSPAAMPCVIGVESSDEQGELSFFSNYDPDGPLFCGTKEGLMYNFELRAPGSNITSTTSDGGYGIDSGTSFAAPLVAGVISRLISIKDYNSTQELLYDLIISRGKNYGPIDAMMAYEGYPQPAFVSFSGKDQRKNCERNIHLQNFCAKNLTDSTMNSLCITASLADPTDSVAIRILHDTHMISPIEADSLLYIPTLDIAYSFTDNVTLDTCYNLKLTISCQNQVMDSALYSIHVDKNRYNPEGFLAIVTDSLANTVEITGYADISDTCFIPDTILMDGIPMQVKSIGMGALSHSTFKVLEISGSVSYTNMLSFNDCRSLETVTFHEGVRTIGDYSFYNCISLKHINFAESIDSIGESAFFCCDSLESIVIPEGIRIVNCLNDAESLTSVVYPSTSVLIDNNSGYFPSLTSVTCLAVTPPVFVSDYNDLTDYSIITLYVPQGSAAAYREAENWCRFGNIVEINPTGVSAKAKSQDDKEYYNISGRQASPADDGILIHDGRKYLK